MTGNPYFALCKTSAIGRILGFVTLDLPLPLSCASSFSNVGDGDGVGVGVGEGEAVGEAMEIVGLAFLSIGNVLAITALFFAMHHFILWTFNSAAVLKVFLPQRSQTTS